MDSLSNTLYFKKDMSQAMPVKKGDVIVSSAGNGLLRKVSEVVVSGDSLIVKTTDASLTDAVNSGETSFSETLSEQKIAKVNYLKMGVVLDTSQMKSTENTPLNYTIDIYLDADHKIHLTGGFSILTGLHGKVRIGYIPPRINLFQLTYDINQNFDLSEDIELVDMEYDNHVKLASIDFLPIIAVISGVPVVLVPQLEITAGISSKVHCNVSSGINQQMDFTIGFKYEDHDWSTIKQMKKSFNFTPPQLNCNADARAYIKPQLNIKIYNVLAPYLYADLYVKIEAEISQNPWWNIYAGADMGVGIKAAILGKEIFDFNTNPPLISYEKLIASAPLVTDPLVAGFTASPTSGTVPLNVNFTDQSTNSPTSWQWDFGDGGTSTEQNPLHTYDNAGTFTVSLTATNNYGSNTITNNSYITVSNGGGGTGTFTDPRDGQTYATVEIGNQTWFAENLNYETSNSWTYDNDPANGDVYGRLYTWDAALTACPSGWHLPSDEEWKTLEMALGMSQSEADDTGLRGTDQGEQMKSTSGWHDNGNGTNSSGFNALPGGIRGNTGSFGGLGYTGYWWSSTDNVGSSARDRYLTNYDGRVARGSYTKTVGISVRCIKN